MNKIWTKDELTFNKWSKERIALGRKFCTSRSKNYGSDPRVKFVVDIQLKYVRDFLFQTEGADSPEEFEKVWRSLHRGRFNQEDYVVVHFGDFREIKK